MNMVGAYFRGNAGYFLEIAEEMSEIVDAHVVEPGARPHAPPGMLQVPRILGIVTALATPGRGANVPRLLVQSTAAASTWSTLAIRS